LGDADRDASEVMAKANIALIGMPGSGKTCLGRQLASDLSYSWLDIDNELHDIHGRIDLKTIGAKTFLEREERLYRSIAVNQTVISCSGSSVYSESAMNHIAGIASVIYLKLPLAAIKTRLGDYSSRNVVNASSMSLESLYSTRSSLYERYADYTVDVRRDDLLEQYLELLMICTTPA
jgi:shikimate kinase